VRVDEEMLRDLVLRHAPQQILMEKEVYSLFANPNADRVLDLVTGPGTLRFLVFGVALDYCVRAAALGLVDWLERRQREGEVWLLSDATASVDPGGGEAALRECVSRGVRSVTTAEALAALD
jgi:nicotinamidase/pyrazinamidase